MTISCQEPLPTNQVDPTENKGYLHLSDLSVELVADQKENSNEVTRVATRNDEEFLATFDCYVYDENGQNVIKQFKYGDRPEGDIELEAGKYIFKMISSEIAPAAFEQPVYGVTEVFTIVRKQTTELKNLVCTLQNIQTTISYSADLRAALSDDTVATLSIGEASLDFIVDETRSGYFKAVNPLNDIDILVKGMYTQEGKEPAPFEFTTTIKDVKAGQYSDIQLYIEYSGEGSIALSVTIDGWVVDESLVFDLAQLIAEDILVDDTDKPTINIVDGDIDNPVVIAATDFDENGNYTKSLIVEVASKSAISSLLVDIESTNAEMISSLATYHLSESFDLCNMSNNAATILRNLMKLPCNDQVVGQTAVTYNLSNIMSLLVSYVGEHKFTATITDEKGGKTVKTLTIVVEGEQTGPVVVWKGYNIDQRYDVVEGMTVDIVVTAPAGIKDFTVKIISSVLTPDQLGGVGLCDILNLAEPTASYSTVDPSFDTSGIATSLTNLGFPIGDAVKNQTKVEFSITQFLSLLSFTGAGDHSFEMTITDNDGNVTVKTLMITTL
jgi:hypothetical protein